MSDGDAGSLEEIVQLLSAQRRCLHCGEMYTERESMGRLECRRHTGTQQAVYCEHPDGVVGTWSCCGVAWLPRHERWRGVEAARGCAALDHTDSIGMPENERLPYERAVVLFGDDLRRRKTIFKRATREIVIVRASSAFG